MAGDRSIKEGKKRRGKRPAVAARGGQGLDVPPSPRAEGRAKGGPGKQPEHPWPGSEKLLRPRADHGEESYVGAGKLEGTRALITGG
jgi:hypothetical protein